MRTGARRGSIARPSRFAPRITPNEGFRRTLASFRETPFVAEAAGTDKRRLPALRAALTRPRSHKSASPARPSVRPFGQATSQNGARCRVSRPHKTGTQRRPPSDPPRPPPPRSEPPTRRPNHNLRAPTNLPAPSDFYLVSAKGVSLKEASVRRKYNRRRIHCFTSDF